MIEAVFFDLDGTLSDSAPGILGSLQLAFAEVGVPWPSEEVARTLLGPPFWHSLPPLVGADKLDEVVARYRKHYVDDRGLFRTERYAGVVELLEYLQADDYRLAVATSKPEPHAIEIVQHLGLSRFFQTIGGDTLDGQRDSKALVIGDVLKRFGNPDPAEILMIGDRSHDVLGAAAHGIECAGALWGYGTAEELTAAGAVRLCADPDEVLDLLLGT